MRRTSLLLFVIAPLLLLLLLAQLAGPQAQRTLQAGNTPTAIATGALSTPDADPTEANAEATADADADDAMADEVAPAGTNIFTATTPFSPALGIRIRSQVPLTIALAPGALGAVTASVDIPLLSAEPLTLTLPATRPSALDDEEEIAATSELTVGLELTTSTGLTESVLITGADLLTDVQIPLTGAGALDDIPALTLTVGSTATASITGAMATTLEIPSSALETPVLTTTVGAPVGEELTSTADLTEAVTATPDIAAGLPMTLEFDISVLVTDTFTSTVPATLVLRISGMPSVSVPISVVFGSIESALVNLEPVTITEALTEGEALTETEVEASEELTGSEELTTTADLTPAATPAPLVPVTVTVPVSTNVRPGPGVNFDPVRVAPPGSVLEVLAIDASREWLLLTDGNWIAVVVLGAAPADLPVATTELVEEVRAEAALRTPTPTPTPPPPTITPTPLPPSGPITGTTTTNANLRSGPGTTFGIVGNTVLGQVVTVITRNEAGDWLQLDSGSWISAALVAGLTDVARLPVFDPDATATPTPPPAAPAAGVTGTVTATLAAPLLPTATPRPGETPAAPAATPAPVATPAPLTVEENLYLVEFDTIARKYELALTGVDSLVDSASGNPAVLTDPQWQTDMSTAVGLLRSAGQNVAALAVPERFAAAHASLETAATQYNLAADALAAGIAQGSVEPFTEAFSAITLGDAALAQASTALAAFRP